MQHSGFSRVRHRYKSNKILLKLTSFVPNREEKGRKNGGKIKIVKSFVKVV